ncbi:MAG: type II secretion system F family protein [bacterium]
MLRFKFKAKSMEGVSRTGIVEAQSLEAAADVLRGQKLVVINLRETGSNEGSLFSFMDKVKFEDIVNFTRQLSTMISAGLPLTDSLSILQVQTKPALQKRVSEVLKAIEGGSTFADALANQGEVFSKVYVSLVRAGESAGVLDTILIRLADNLEKQREFQAKTKGALIYPLIVMIGMMVVGFVMMVFVLPKLTVMYEDFQVDLPIVTKILIGFSNILTKVWYLVILGVAGAVYAVGVWRKTKAGALRTDQILLKLPIFGKIKVMTTMAEFSRTLALLASAGVALVEGLEIVREVMNNVVFSSALKEVVNDVEHGNSLATSLAKHESFPMIVSQMVSVGEQTGKLDDVLTRVAGYFETESEHAIKNLSTAMEPIIMVVLGVGVGFLVIAIIVPIYNLTSAF